METIGDRILRLRESRGWTQQQLGDYLSVSDGTVSTWEVGRRTPRMGAVESMAELFKVKKSYIIDGTADIPLNEGVQFTPEEDALLQYFHQIPMDQRSMVLEMMAAAAKQSQYTDKRKR